MNKQINALFDCVTTIDRAIAGDVTPGVDPRFVVQANVDGLEAGLTNSEILDNLTLEQKSQLQAGLARGKAFL